ncbi:hypothetical protein [Sulfuricurvum sp. RIFCSPLOWO2_12_FULL_43_24]|uniref:CiaD-like domain-containing protein n=1 Tax=Sulfuricurvum sp. RIFCSPLOWO2_12_FULL_43_24 TaxID=1802247 RepID=UPI0008B1361E|nr:hypothetical protein [Sulfuricurvum sp. RIFCSPLOWO2_12_FULL_43_24]OHD83907.1 MAG: hypothetical protein A2Y52_04035 [Sulfuricurvum sp. RIFCSPLOWO2_02_43_6]OHD85628.1 MAG: hypothetical protein A3I60_07480 [Sulfuricurvum sp. RIFCSPLOWO2_02_FULL_43_45]OHD88577.1 MAG: hypothetical protein A3G19_10730 [Sulfuricurvum sp. RIFCSPLOWO2_12_FULL_43_24]
MELKDVILSTLAEIEELAASPESAEKIEPLKEENPFHHDEPIKKDHLNVESIHTVRDDEARMLEGIRERLLVLFEGFQSPNNVQIEAKVDLTLNFLEYLLATIDHRLDTIK